MEEKGLEDSFSLKILYRKKKKKTLWKQLFTRFKAFDTICFGMIRGYNNIHNHKELAKLLLSAKVILQKVCFFQEEYFASLKIIFTLLISRLPVDFKCLLSQEYV